MALGATASAQAQVFQLNEEKSAELSPVHRSTPIIGDVNNDGTPEQLREQVEQWWREYSKTLD